MAKPEEQYAGKFMSFAPATEDDLAKDGMQAWITRLMHHADNLPMATGSTDIAPDNNQKHARCKLPSIRMHNSPMMVLPMSYSRYANLHP